MTLPNILQLTPEYRDYVWGGARLRPKFAEAWVVYAEDRVASGLFLGVTLSKLAEKYGAELLGTRPFGKTGTRFPLLIKLLDCA